MESMEDFCFPLSHSIHPQLPIRRFCRAAREEEEDDGSPWELPPDAPTAAYTPSSADSLLDEFRFVDSFLNMDHHQNDHHHQPPPPYESFLHDDSMMGGGDDGSLSAGYDAAAVDEGVDEGLRLVHLVLACAEAVGCRDARLAESILAQIWCSATPLGDSLHRVSYFFAVGLKSRLENSRLRGCTREERVEALHLLHRTTPYSSFGFTAANQAICDAAAAAAAGRQGGGLHILDLGMEHTLQWPALIRSLKASPEILRITGVTGDRGNVSDLESEIQVVVAEADLLGIRVEFRLIPGPATAEMLTRENLGVVEGEALFVNSVLHLHTYAKEGRGCLTTVLQAVRKLRPRLLTVVEQDANHNGPFFLGRFLEALHYYSAIFDSLEAVGGGIERMKIERNHFGEEIRNIVACEGEERVERHERADQWRRQLGRAGFQAVAVGMKTDGGSGGGGYTVGSDGKPGFVLLGWKGRPIMVASAWQPHPSSAAV